MEQSHSPHSEQMDHNSPPDGEHFRELDLGLAWSVIGGFK